MHGILLPLPGMSYEEDYKTFTFMLLASDHSIWWQSCVELCFLGSDGTIFLLPHIGEEHSKKT